MRKIIGVLFPWWQTFRRLELENRWWHRLAVVLFLILLIPLFLYSWVIASDTYEPAHSVEGEIQYWEVLPTPPDGFTVDQTATPVAPPPDGSFVGQGKVATPLDIFDRAAGVKNSDMLKTIEMPDGNTVTYPGTTSDETIKAEWNHKVFAAESKAALLGFGIAVLLTMIFSYLLQAMYRAALYVIFGTKAKTASPTPTQSQG